MMSLKRKRRLSLSGKLLLLFIIMAVIFVMFVGGGIRHAFQGHFKENIRPHINQYLEYVQADIGIPPDRDRAQELADRLNIEIQIFDRKGSWSSGVRRADLAKLDIEGEFIANGKVFFHVEDDNRHYLMLRDGDATLLFNVPNLRDQRKGFKGWIPLLILLFILLVLYHATRRLFAPLKNIQEGVRKFGDGDMAHRINIKRRDELGELAGSFNTMADEIQQMLDAKRQLLLAISHELRSPLTRTRIAAEMLDDNERKAEIIQDVHEMESLIEELMETERLSSRHTKLNKAHHDVISLVSDVISTYFHGVDIRADFPASPVILNVDTARIKLLLKNLLDNAVRHTPDNTLPSELRLCSDERKVLITVIDHGYGIEAHHLPHLTEPFYRVDPSRQRETGGYGLGLYLCRMIAEAHGGKLVIESTPGKGTTVLVELPVPP